MFGKVLNVAATSLVFSSAFANGESSAERAEELLLQMNTTEKLDMLHGHKGTYVGNIVGNERLGIPSINMHDGPQGFRVTTTTAPEGSTTAWPSALTAASSWDTDLIYRFHAGMATEFKTKGANVQLAPGIGIARVANAGRNFEYLCGEDPMLGAGLVGSAVKGIQDQGIIANAKHWVNNEIEEKRKTVSSNVNQKTRFEMYYPPFEAAVKSGVLSVMCSYNRINDEYACQNKETLAGDLKGTLDFKGWVMSDWLATHSTVNAMQNGLDQELPYGIHYRQSAIEEALESGDITIANIDDSIRRILTSMFEIGLFDHEPEGDPHAIATSNEHNSLTREIAAKASVLVKHTNDVLPIAMDSLKGKCIAVFGDETTVSGTGSGRVQPPYVITPQEGIRNALKSAGYSEDDVQVKYVSGLDGDIDEAVSLASSCDLSVVVVATTSGEGNDRDTLSLGSASDDLVKAVADVSDHTIVSVVTPAAVLLPWKDVEKVDAIVISGLPGQEAGNALADVLFGAVNPSGKLPVTIPNMDNEVNFTPEQYPGVGFPPEADYTERSLFGYRWYDYHDVTPAYCFGHGLSYTTFKYGDLKLTSADGEVGQEVELDVANSGTVAGSEVVQLYLSTPASTGSNGESLRQLRSFVKVNDLSPTSTETIKFTLSPRDLSAWDEQSQDWRVVKGTYTVYIGSSSCDFRQSATFVV